MIVNLYTGNHAYTKGIEDFVRMIREIVGRRGVVVQVSSRLLPGAVNLVIDEFTNYRENRTLRAFKRDHPESRLIFVLTEFAQSRLGVRTLNLFGGLVELALICLLNVYLPKLRDDFPKARAADWARAAVAAPVVGMWFLGFAIKSAGLWAMRREVSAPVDGLLQRFHRVIYNHFRYLGLSANLHLAEAVVTSHECVYETLDRARGSAGPLPPCLGVLYPEFDVPEVVAKVGLNRSPFIEMTGTITQYRRKCLASIDWAINALGMKSVFGFCKTFPMVSMVREDKSIRGAYSLHPPQSPDWPYCSPTRIYRALSVEHNLPVLTQYFGQNPIEDVCFLYEDRYSIVELYEMHLDRARLIEFIYPRINRYNLIARERNDRCVEALRNLMGVDAEMEHSAKPDRHRERAAKPLADRMVQQS